MNTTQTTEQTIQQRVVNARCPQCSKLMTMAEMHYNACESCYNAIGTILKPPAIVLPEAPLTYIKTTEINGESHD